MHWGYDIVCDNSLRLPSNNQSTEQCAMHNVHELSVGEAFVLGPSCPCCTTAHCNTTHPSATRNCCSGSGLWTAAQTTYANNGSCFRPLDNL